MLTTKRNNCYDVTQAQQKGYKYLIMSDDDYVIQSEALIPGLAQLMVEMKADVVAPVRCDAPKFKCIRGEVASFVRGKGSGPLGGDEVFMLNNVTRVYPDDKLTLPPSSTDVGSLGNRFDCQRSDIVQQFFLASVEMLLKSGWDDTLKNNDHYDAMLCTLRAPRCLQRLWHAAAKTI